MIEQAIRFLETTNRPVELAWVRWLASDSDRDRDRSAVLSALATYQNSDGGFGHGFEVDIQAPQSNPFATRLAMQVLLSIGATTTEPIVARLVDWLETTQDDDGCWRFTPEIYQHDLAPWFASWTFPNLNPPLCLAGCARRLGFGSDRLFTRVATLTDELAAFDTIKTGDFYTLLPYVEYFPWIDHPLRGQYLDALAARIQELATTGGYDDAGHFFGHLGPLDGPLAERVDPSLISAQLARLRDEQQGDGGWPSPYSADWRPWITAEAISRLKEAERRAI